jgi:hypothetical protein
MITRGTVSPIMRALFKVLEDEVVELVLAACVEVVVEPVLAAYVDVVLICRAAVAAAAPRGKIEDAQARCLEQMKM